MKVAAEDLVELLAHKCEAVDNAEAAVVGADNYLYYNTAAVEVGDNLDLLDRH